MEELPKSSSELLPAVPATESVGAVAVTGASPDLVSQEVPAMNSDKFGEYPTTKVSLMARDPKGREVYAVSNQTSHERGCQCCADTIPPYSPHVITRIIGPTKRREPNKRRMHISCFMERVINNWQDVGVVDSSGTSPKMLDAKHKAAVKAAGARSKSR